MAYTVKISLVDVSTLYPSNPTLSGVLNAPNAFAPASATSTTPPFSISFASLPSPPTVPGTLHLSDPSGPGDFFRSGVVSRWPPGPAEITVFTIPTTAVPALPNFPGAGRYSYQELTDMLTPSLPIIIDLPWWVATLCGFITGGRFIPYTLWIKSVSLSQSATVSGAVRAVFEGTISFNAWIIPSTANYVGIVDLTLAPSGDALVPRNIVKVSASNLSIRLDFISFLVNAAISILAPFFSGNLSDPLTDRINGTLAPIVASALATGAAPGLSSASTVSARSIKTFATGIVVQTIVGDLAPPRTLSLSMVPVPKATTTISYIFTVTDAASGVPIPGANVRLDNYTSSGASVSSTVVTDAAGRAIFNVSLHTKNTTISTSGVNDAGKPDRETERVTFYPKVVVQAASYLTLTRTLLM